MKRGGRDCRQQDVDRGTGQRHPHHVDPGVVERAKIDRHRFGVAEQERCVRQQQQPRQQNGAERIDVFERIKTNAAQFPRSIVAEEARDEAMGGLVKRDRDEEREYPDRDVVEGDVERQLPVLRVKFDALRLPRIGV
jgi:hypothetical protein